LILCFDFVEFWLTCSDFWVFGFKNAKPQDPNKSYDKQSDGAEDENPEGRTQHTHQGGIWSHDSSQVCYFEGGRL
jgi:hypothetical protein